jgi:16S rRNA A1518/A1519 N6-dimethyltransferase RsmA/KsgA/DIM1 with predicted DNA glycosylase/AP lyase activity
MLDSLAPYVPSEPYVVKRMLEVAQVGPEDIVFDLGCGDGRILITAVKDFGAKKAVGYEMQKDLYTQALNNVKKQGLANRIKVINGNLLKADITQATVITLYLTTSGNKRLRFKFENEVKDGARIVSHAFTISGWNPSMVDEIEEPYGPILYLYVMPEGYQERI